MDRWASEHRSLIGYYFLLIKKNKIKEFLQIFRRADASEHFVVDGSRKTFDEGTRSILWICQFVSPNRTFHKYLTWINNKNIASAVQKKKIFQKIVHIMLRLAMVRFRLFLLLRKIKGKKKTKILKCCLLAFFAIKKNYFSSFFSEKKKIKLSNKKKKLKRKQWMTRVLSNSFQTTNIGAQIQMRHDNIHTAFTSHGTELIVWLLSMCVAWKRNYRIECFFFFGARPGLKQLSFYFGIRGTLSRLLIGFASRREQKHFPSQPPLICHQNEWN